MSDSANASCGLALQLNYQGVFDEAVYHNDRALRTWHFVGNERFASCHIAFLGIILANIGSRQEVQKSKQCFTQAVALLSIADTQYPPDDEMLGYYRFTNRSVRRNKFYTLILARRITLQLGPKANR